MGKLGTAIARRPKTVVVVSLLFVVISGVLAAPVMTSLSRSTDDFQDPQAEFVSARDAVEQATGADAQLGVVVLIDTPGSPIVSPIARQRIRQVERAVKADSGADRYFDYLNSKNKAFIARDSRSTYVAVGTVKGELGDKTGKRLKDELAQYSWARVGGSDIIFDQIGEQVSADLAQAEMIAFPILFLLSLLVFRGFVAALLPVFVGGVSIVITLLLLRVANETAGLSVFAVNIVTGLGLGLAIDYSLFMVSRYREELAQIGPGSEALVRTMKSAGRTVLFSSLTVAVAMSALLIFPIRFLYSVGLGGMLVALVGMVVALVLLPAVLHLLGNRINAGAPKRWQRHTNSAGSENQGFWYRLAQGVMRRPIPVALASAALMLLLTYPSLRIEFNAADATALPKGTAARDVSDVLDSKYPPSSGSQAVTVLVSAPRDAAKQAHLIEQRFAVIPNAKGVESPQPIAKNLWRMDVLTSGEARSEENQQLLRKIRSMSLPYKHEVTGPAAYFVDEKDSIVDNLPLAMGLLAAGTFILLFLLTGSVLLPIKALVMNMLTVGAAFGILVFVFQDGRLESLLNYTSNGGLETTQPVLLFAMAFGLSTDYGVFLLSRIKEARDSGMEDREAVAFGLERTGRIVTAAALLFCVAVGAFASSEVLFIKQVGLGTALAVAIDATIVRALLVPSLMALMGKWNWWAPRPLAKLHAKLGLQH